MHKLKDIISKDQGFLLNLQEGIIDQVGESYDKDMEYFGTMQYYYFVDKLQTFHNKVLLIANRNIFSHQQEINDLKIAN